MSKNKVSDPITSQSTFASRINPSEAPPLAPYVPDTKVPFSIKKNPFAHPR